MAKSDKSENFDDYMDNLKNVKLPLDRRNLKPVDPTLTFEQYLAIAVAEGHAMLDAEALAPTKKSKLAPKAADALDDALAKLSDNPYVRARVEILKKMTPIERSVIEKMEKGDLEKDHRYDAFCKAVCVRGDQISSGN